MPNETTPAARHAAIRRAGAEARAALGRLDAEILDALVQIYGETAERLRADLDRLADEHGNLSLEVTAELLTQVSRRLVELAQQRDPLLSEALRSAAALGAQVWKADPAVGMDITRLADEAVRTALHFQAADGLQLSERIWRLDRGAREQLAGGIRTAIAQGWDASRATREFLGAGREVPPDVAARAGAAQASRVARTVAEQLAQSPGSAYEHARRVFRTEINRAHGLAYAAGAQQHPDAAGLRFLLSPRHKVVDICDQHARLNLHGLGPGVYPFSACPWPAHPNTLSYTEIVFKDEVTAEDRAGRTDRLSWLRTQPQDVQAGILGAQKADALRAGALTADDLDRPWSLLKDDLARRGYAAPPAA